ncbi:MAG: hypothetical protein IT376_15835 [Polyangiaceae bacterium]|nr:hypothetical protein [Polyangiaceae bacterium]
MSRPGAHVARVLGLAIVLGAAGARAQDPFGGALPEPPSKPQPSATPRGGEPPPGTPDVRPAAGGDTTLPEGNEPSLPRSPLRVPARLRSRIGTNAMPSLELDLGRAKETERSFYGLWYSERSGDYSLKLAFPVWGERKMPSRGAPQKPDRASLYGGLYYNRRSADRADDILFPLVWNLRDLKLGARTTIVGPVVNRRAPGESDDWLAPLYFTGRRKVGGYTVIPPLLTVLSSSARGGFDLVGPAFCSWRGGQSCDTRTAQDLDLGVAPLYFYGQNETSKYEVIPPLLHYYSYDDRDRSWVNVWGPLWRQHSEQREYLHLLPFYWSIWGKQERHTTLLPFFHHGYDEKSWLHVNPLFLLAKGAEGESTFITWGYARYRGRTELDMITPLYWHYRDPTIGLDQKLLFPFLYSRTSPRESSQVFFPFWGRFERYGVSRSTWVTPFIQHRTDLRGWETNIHPIVYLGRSGHQSHTVVAPFFWDFVGRESRATVGFPVYWRFSDRDEVSQLVGNVYYHESKLKNGLDWEIHVFPFFTYGETPDGHWWNVLYGLAGYTRRGDHVQVRTLWVPITVSGEEAP